ncbi:acyltransferase family [Plasmopara halstedii]|uniref:Acyltransferase family n=1 Tax=Plasmopara halstedii TaxID=4781 RepID=A0A0P1AL37_PLAHL|nr:acyltransferase family [Plasmopara halstedii]CEG41641.1 acyltransferase family [Plasmopara halstedii]|eukprot:XP_024578010.1 acyltransferase family [Plasmopara halstedii]
MVSEKTRRSQRLDATPAVDLLELVVNDVKNSSPVPRSRDQQLQQSVEDKTIIFQGIKTKTAPVAQTKVIFLDGARGLAAMLVVIQHADEFMPNLHLGSVGVDIFFVLSSFLLTWLFMLKSMKLLSKGAHVRTWAFTLADYFQKRFLRVYPMFFVTVILLSFLSVDDQRRYYIGKRPPFDLVKTLTFSYEYRYHVFWSLPLEITYYFLIPIFVLAVLSLRRFWWIPALLLTVWIVHEGVFGERQSHAPMRPHISTFLTGSLAATVYVKADMWIKKTKFVFRCRHIILVRAIEGLTILMLLSVCFRGLLFNWIHQNPAPRPIGFPYTSAFLAIILVIEVINPSCVASMLEWNVLRYWGKISFSIYLLHSFVVYHPKLSQQANYFDRFFSRLVIILAISTAAYYLVEYPSLLLAQKVSRLIANAEKRFSVDYTELAETEVLRRKMASR